MENTARATFRTAVTAQTCNASACSFSNFMLRANVGFNATIRHISPQQLSAYLSSHPNDIAIVDLRTRPESVGKQIEGAIAFPVDNSGTAAQQALAALRPQDTLADLICNKAFVVFHCVYGADRTPAAAWAYYQNQGLVKNPNQLVIGLDGGFTKWVSDGQKVVPLKPDTTKKLLAAPRGGDDVTNQ